MHPDIESYLIAQSLSDKKIKQIEKQGKEYVVCQIDSIMLRKNMVIISNEWFLLHVYDRFVKKIISLLIKAGVDREDISYFNDGLYTKIYVIQNPSKFIPILMKFEKLIKEQ